MGGGDKLLRMVISLGAIKDGQNKHLIFWYLINISLPRPQHFSSPTCILALESLPVIPPVRTVLIGNLDFSVTNPSSNCQDAAPASQLHLGWLLKQPVKKMFSDIKKIKHVLKNWNASTSKPHFQKQISVCQLHVLIPLFSISTFTPTSNLSKSSETIYLYMYSTQKQNTLTL